MIRVTKIATPFVLLFLLTGCSARMMKSTRTSGDVNLQYFSETIQRAEIPKAEEDLTRSCHQSYFPYDNWVGLTYLSWPLAEARARKRVADDAYKNKWSEAEAQKEFKTHMRKLKKELANVVCFSVEVQTDDPFANEPKAWYGDVILPSKERLPLVFDAFDGFNSREIHVYMPQNGTATAYDVNNFHLYSTACTSKSLDTSKGFEVIVEPRYKPGIKPCTLQWNIPK